MFHECTLPNAVETQRRFPGSSKRMHQKQTMISKVFRTTSERIADRFCSFLQDFSAIVSFLWTSHIIFQHSLIRSSVSIFSVQDHNVLAKGSRISFFSRAFQIIDFALRKYCFYFTACLRTYDFNVILIQAFRTYSLLEYFSMVETRLSFAARTTASLMAAIHEKCGTTSCTV